jgi:hypothetical protein
MSKHPAFPFQGFLSWNDPCHVPEGAHVEVLALGKGQCHQETIQREFGATQGFMSVAQLKGAPTVVEGPGLLRARCWASFANSRANEASGDLGRIIDARGRFELHNHHIGNRHGNRPSSAS